MNRLRVDRVAGASALWGARALWGACALLLVAGCASAPVLPPEPIAPTYMVLDDAGVVALAELLRMEDGRVFDAELVRRHLADTVPEVRGRAVLAAGRVRDRSAVPLLLHALEDVDASVRARAAFSLGHVGDPSSAVLAGLSDAALGSSRDVAVEAVSSLGRLGSPLGRSTLDSILSLDRPTPAVLQAALLAVWRLPRDIGTVTHTVRWTRSEDAETRWRAAYALARAAGPFGVATLLELVDDEDDRVRANAVRGLRASVADSAGLRERSLSALLDAARDVHPHVRINALDQIAAYRLNHRTTPVLTAALRDVHANVAVAAATALGQAGDPMSAPALYDATGWRRPDGLRTAALHALVRVDTAAGAELATQWADSARWILRMHAARALGQVRTHVAAATLQQMTRESHYLVSMQALNALRSQMDTLADSFSGSRHVFIEQLAAAHPLVRAAAIRGVGATAGPADLDIVLEAYDHARQDTIRDAALAAVMALARIRRAGVPVERAFFLRFGDGGAPRDDVVHRAIIDSIGAPPPSWGQPAARAIEVRPLQFYVDRIRAYVAPVLAGAQAPRAVITTVHGDIVLELAAPDAPLTVDNFITLAERGYYALTRWHRVVPNFVIQDGDPRGDGSGSPGYMIRDEINTLRYDRGSLGMALSGPDTGGGQYFITHSPQPHLDGGYTIFGRVVEGMDVVDRVVQEDAILGIRVIR